MPRWSGLAEHGRPGSGSRIERKRLSSTTPMMVTGTGPTASASSISARKVWPTACARLGVAEPVAARRVDRRCCSRAPPSRAGLVAASSGTVGRIVGGAVLLERCARQAARCPSSGRSRARRGRCSNSTARRPPGLDELGDVAMLGVRRRSSSGRPRRRRRAAQTRASAPRHRSDLRRSYCRPG